jgi:hypothetical protein
LLWVPSMVRFSARSEVAKRATMTSAFEPSREVIVFRR